MYLDMSELSFRYLLSISDRLALILVVSSRPHIFLATLLLIVLNGGYKLAISLRLIWKLR